MGNPCLQLPLFAAQPDPDGPASGVIIRNSSRAKRLSIKVFPRGRVEVVVPRRTSVRAVRAFVEENRDWIGRARDSFAEHYSPEAFRLPDIVRLPSVGVQVVVRYRPQAAAKTVRYRHAHGILDLSGNTGSEKHCVDALRRWLSATARKEFAPQLQALSRLTGTPYANMHIRMQRTCWGSRSSTGTISLNLCLLFVSADLLRYLMIHELCHGRHMNHSKRFWKMVSAFEPRYRKLDHDLGESWRDVPAWLGVY